MRTKQSAFFYNLKSLALCLQPLLPGQKGRIKRRLAQLASLPLSSLESIKDRVNKACALPPHQSVQNPPLGLFKGLSLGSRYFYDFMAYFRFFDQSLRYQLEYGDVNYNLLTPTLCKSRPIPQIPHSNNVLLPLDKRRHFKHIFPPCPMPFEAKQNKLFFRGACFQPHRLDFLKHYFKHPLMDLGHVGALTPALSPFSKPRASIAQHLEHKFILSLEGFDVASNLKWILSSNSVAMMPPPKFESFFLESQLVPYIHYIPLKPDYSDTPAQIEFFSARPKDCLEMICHANTYVKSFLTPLEEWTAFLVLRKYFYYTGQVEPLEIEKALFN
ncbi:glycosyl transferase family 90 [Helicobacter ailurogastricus]|uniref:Lipopolysaccharide core biosynthesis protein LpsA n=1 Tax=Helicobacter ailurogastricus TaxID=1578720 RepID=A0A0K2X4P2_9HELI|nr:glycosyl transferase family 90 [Helicobacter ailurogastricus]CRF41079.1 LpsA protein [Helicobacter ailurogastricus]CRF42175.1 LpsA protein [Helicobacter ailurogastricus]CRF44244.1 LpsA protein [Helicobacter ailurogastricus]CRF52808.1 Lipopolysaccharide core biosynthesis protein LpsA [Helicobacter ailurogastricus]BDQ28273.1 hypothetical protein ASB7_01100 [Helicobacter ailurogastricus]